MFRRPHGWSHLPRPAMAPSPRQTPESWHRVVGLPLPSRRLSAIRLVPSPPQSFFSAKAHPLQEPPEDRFAKALAGKALQEVAPFFDGGRRSCAYVFSEQPLCSFVCYGGSATS